RPSPLTSRFLFRESIAIGYELNANWRIMAFADHGSVGNLSYRNIGLNRFGVLLGNKFGPSTRKPLIADSAPSLSTFSWAGPYVGFGVALARSGFHFKSPTPESTEAGNSVNLAGQVGYNLVFGSARTGGRTRLCCSRSQRQYELQCI
ncbi:MAG: acyloxyacyl hydrolase, partial [Pseudolabrys sp.]